MEWLPEGPCTVQVTYSVNRHSGRGRHGQAMAQQVSAAPAPWEPWFGERRQGSTEGTAILSGPALLGLENREGD